MKYFRERAAFILLLFLTAFGACATRKDLEPVKPDAPRVLVQLSGEGADAAEPAAASDGSGNFYFLFVEHAADKSADVFLRKFDAGLKPEGGRVRVNPTLGEA